ncbi:EVE domain-containing protein [Rheinheimera sp.]|uniref:EVE domain-containing protein n=1 Tax=Rheinheimera sp. TaxID=1869214 RepID=UPI00307F299A
MYWLYKTEPEECSIDDFANNPTKPIVWEGVRNYQARNFLRAAALDDLVLIYHSSCKLIGLAGIARVVKTAYPDPSQFQPDSIYFDARSSATQPRWFAVELIFVQKFPSVVPLDKLKRSSKLEQLALVQKGSRLSVMPVQPDEWQVMLAMATKE